MSDLSCHPLSARVGSLYYSYAAGFQQTVQVNDPCSKCYKPEPRFDHHAALIGDKWYVIGGMPSNPSYVQEYNVISESWHQYETQGDIPLAICGVACTSLSSRGKVLTFGGCTRDRKYTNILSELDVDTMVWQTLKPVQMHHCPQLKRDAAILAHHNTLVTFGGYGTFLESIKQSRASYFKDGTKAEVWTNELTCYDLDKSELVCVADWKLHVHEIPEPYYGLVNQPFPFKFITAY